MFNRYYSKYKQKKHLDLSRITVYNYAHSGCSYVMIDIKIPKLQGLWFNINETLISSTDSKLKNWNEIEEIYVLIDYLVDGLNMIADDQLKILLNLMKIAFFFRVFEGVPENTLWCLYSRGFYSAVNHREQSIRIPG